MLVYLAITIEAKSEKIDLKSEESITFENIFKAVNEIGVLNPEHILENCKEVVKSNWREISKSYALSEEEAVLVNSYTYGGASNLSSPYRIINKKLRERDIQDQLTNKKSYLRLLLRALRKLPRTKPQTLYRGVEDDKHEYEIGETIVWKGFSSTSTSMKATKYFLTNKETKKVGGTFFEVQPMWGYDILKFSNYPKEQGETVYSLSFLLLFL